MYLLSNTLSKYVLVGQQLTAFKICTWCCPNSSQSSKMMF